MTCIACGASMKTTRENVKHPALGLPNLTLVGVAVHRCKSCGEVEIDIPRLDDLIQTVAQAVARKPERLTPDEMRFLRKALGWSGIDVAEHFAVSQQTVSRWENGKQDMGVVAERLLRLCVLSREPVKDYSILKSMATSENVSEPIRMALKGHWHQAA